MGYCYGLHIARLKMYYNKTTLGILNKCPWEILLVGLLRIFRRNYSIRLSNPNQIVIFVCSR